MATQALKLAKLNEKLMNDTRMNMERKVVRDIDVSKRECLTAVQKAENKATEQIE